jgi:diguanylate cyclase (GGDEF)-like protein/PAS domain S-box-containing protein
MCIRTASSRWRVSLVWSVVSQEEDHSAIAAALFEATSDPIVVSDDSGRIVLANAACEPLLGYRPGELAGTAVEALVPGRFRHHEEMRKRYTASPRPRAMGQGLILRAVHADGREIPVDITLTPIRTGGRRFTVATIRDLRGRAFDADTVRVQATALRSAANGIVITDRAGTITWVNPSVCAMTGYAPEELVGQHTRILKSGRHDQSFYETLWKTITAGSAWTGSIVNRRKDGTFYDEEQTIAPVFDDTGQISHYIAIKQDVTARHRAKEALTLAHSELAARLAEIEYLNERLREQSIRDPLTNLFNRRYFEEAIPREAAYAVRSGEPLTIAALDIDLFKRVNDENGHAAGDALLQAFAGVLSREARASDLACRMGGDEFLVILRSTPLDTAIHLVERWRTAFSASPIDLGGGSVVRSSVSIGVALFHAGRETIEDAMRRADSALYEAKRLGRDRVVSAEALGPD